MFKTVLFPIDQSRASQDAAEKVAEVVKFCQSRLVVLSVQPEPVEGEANSAEGVDQLLAAAQAAFSGWEVEVEVLKRQGKPAFCICDVADEIGANVIVMGCRGVGLTEEGAADSVSNRVINLAPCPVLIVP